MGNSPRFFWPKNNGKSKTTESLVSHMEASLNAVIENSSMNVPNERSLFILVDDDSTHNAISRLTILNAVSVADIVIFTDPHVALSYMKNFASDRRNSAVVFLNLNMPFMNGWQFLEHYAKLPVEVKRQLDIYILSASIDAADLVRAKEFPDVKGFLSKPVSAEMLLRL